MKESARAQVFLSSRQNAELNPYREMAADELKKLTEFVSLWRFEESPAAAAPPEALYLEGVRHSDVVLFIAGSDTSDATAAEIAKAIELHRDILAFLLPTDQRTDRVDELIRRIREYATTTNVSAEELDFREAVHEAVRSWLILRLHGGPRPGRSALLETLARRSHFRMQSSWIAAGLSEGLAAELSADSSVGDPNGFVPFDDASSLQILIGPIGSGKTLTLERLYQKAIETATQDVLARVPVFLRASDIPHDLQTAVELAMVDLGSLKLNGVALFIDGLDEVDEPRAERLLRDAWVLVRTFELSRVVLAGRNGAPRFFESSVVLLPELLPHALRALLERIGGVEVMHLLPRERGGVASALLRPLFAIVLAVTGSGPVAEPTERQIAELLITHALSRPERRAAETNLLQRLAVRILDEDSAAVNASEFSEDERMQLLSTRLVVEEGGLLTIPIRLVAERAASIWLQSQERALVIARALAGGRADRWRSAMKQYLGQLQDAEAEDLLMEVAREDLVYSLRLAKADASNRSEPWTCEALRSAIALNDEIMAVALPMLYAMNPSRVEVDKTAHGFVIQREVFDEAGCHRYTTTSFGGVRGCRHAAMLFSRDFAVKLIDNALGDRDLEIQSPFVLEETFWNQTRLVLGYGSLTQQGLPIAQAIERLESLSLERFVCVGDGARQFPIESAPLQARLQALRDLGVEQYMPPFVTEDQPRTQWIWSGYSVQRLLEKRRAVVSAAMEIYKELARTWFPGIANGLRRHLLMPAAHYENIQFDGIHQPVFSEYWLPLPEECVNEAHIAIGPPFDFVEVAGNMRRLVDERRPAIRDRVTITASTGLLRMWSPWPARELAYRWIAKDLKAIGFSTHIRLPYED